MTTVPKTSPPEYVLALDYGDKRVGVAIAHTIARLPRPLTTLLNDDNLLSAIRTIITEEHAGLIVVGLPRGMDGGYTKQTQAAETFAQMLAGQLDVPVELVDETLTSVDAEARLPAGHTKAAIDAMAASLILERYLLAQDGGERA